MTRGTLKTKRPTRAFAALLTAGMLALSACGSSGDSSSDTTAADTSSATTVDAGSETGSGPVGASCEKIDASGGESSGKWELKTSSTPAMLTELETALENCEPIVVTLWRPHWAYAAYSVKDLKDPKGAMGEGEEIWTTANKEWAGENTELADALKSFKMDDDQLASLENFTQNKFADDPEKGAEEWLADDANRKLADTWVEGLEGDGDSVTIGYIAWDEDVAATNLWKVLLEEKGFDVEMTELDAGVLFEGMASGDIDFFFDTWLPLTHADYWDQYGDKLDKLGQWYEGSASLTIAVPTYMNIDSIDELGAWGSDVKDTIIGIEPGAGLTRITQCTMMPTYDLAAKPDSSTCEDG